VEVTPETIGGYSEWWREGLWEQSDAATIALESFMKRFSNIKLTRPVLFRI